MRYQVCENKNGTLKHFYRGKSGIRMSRNKATMLTYGQAKEIMRDLPGELFIQSEYDCHFREVKEDGTIILPSCIDDDLEDMMEYYGLVDRSEDAMIENGVSWSDFI